MSFIFQDLTVFQQTYFYVVCALFGACMGSFLNCCAWRIVHNESVWKGRSHCDLCGHVLTFGDLVPIASYIAHGGKCRWCGGKISSKHLWGEAVSALVFLSALWRFGFTWELPEYFLLGALLLAISFADLEAYIIPDRFIVTAIGVRIVFILLSGEILPQTIFSLLGGSLAVGLLIVVLITEKVIGREAMGGGDLKLVFVTGLYLGLQCNLLGLIIGCVIGIIFGLATQKRREKNEDAAAFPFGPSIALGCWIAVLFGDTIIQSYLSLF